MKRTLFLLGLWAAFSLFSFAQLSPSANLPALIPYPKTLIPGPGSFILPPEIRVQCDDQGVETKSIIEWFQAHCEPMTGIRPRPNVNKENGAAIRITMVPSTPEVAERYRLLIDAGGIQIKAHTPTGLFYAFQTLIQLMPPQSEAPTEGIILPFLEITDQPAFPWRGMLLDCGRSFMDKDFVKRYIDLLAMLKMNRLHWHLTEDQGWRVEIKQYPRLTSIGAWRTLADGSRYGGFYTHEDIREVVEYARQRHIVVVPEIELPGHCVAALAAYPSLSCTGGPFEVETRWGVFKDIYCAGNDSVFVFLKNVLDEVMELFPSPWIHIGGDEVPKYRWENCVKCQRRMQTQGLKDAHELQAWFIGEINDYLKAHGRRLIGWDEILEGGLVEGATVQSWRGFEGAMHAARAGHDAIVSPTSHAYFDYDIGTTSLERVYSFNPVPFGLEPEFRHRILGGECNLWSERAPQELVDSKVFPRILAMAEVLWTDPSPRDYSGFRNRAGRFYPRLNFLGVQYGYEKEPVTFHAQSNAQTRSIQLSLVKGVEEADLRYTLDGSTPGPDSPTAPSILKIQGRTNVQVGAFLEGRGSPEVFSRHFETHLAMGINPNFLHPFSPNYASSGMGALTDGLRGTTQFRDNLWLGFEGENFGAELDLGKPVLLSSITIGFLQSVPSWIFYPETVSVETSLDGSRFHSFSAPNGISWKDEKTTTQDFDFQINQSVRYIRISAKNIGTCPDWHPGAGGKTWIFVDEIVVRE
jgi:hexosaminidase